MNEGEQIELGSFYRSVSDFEDLHTGFAADVEDVHPRTQIEALRRFGPCRRNKMHRFLSFGEIISIQKTACGSRVDGLSHASARGVG